MRLRTRVLSFMLAGSMMLSATPVSAFAGTPVLGGGTVSPTALSETNSTDGVYSSRVDGSHELRCTGGIFTDTQNTTYNNAIYVVNQNSAPAAKLKFTPPDGHSIVAWRIDMGTAWGYNDATNPKVQMLLKAANLKCSADNTELTFTCPGSITYGGETYPAFVADASLTPVLNITAADLLFEKGTIVLGNELSSGSGITATLVYYSVIDGVKGSEAMTTRPTKPGQYQIAVRLSVDGASATDKYANRVKCGNVYYQVDPSQELTSEKWRYRVVSSSVNLTVDANGEPVVPSGTAGVSYANGVLTIYPRFVVHFGVNDIVNCDIVNEGKLDGGLFTGTVTNHGVIESGLFVNKPENAASAKFSFTSGATFCGQKDPSGITSLYVVRTENGQNLHLTASYSNPNRDPFGWVQAIDIPNTTESAYLLYKNPNLNPWTVDIWGDSALPKEQTDVATTFTPVACMKSSDLSIDSTGKVDISIPEVEATGVTYTNKATNETFTSYPTVAGEYEAHVSLKCTRDWNSLANKDPIIPASALLADDGVAALSEEQENLIYRIALKGDLYYFVPETLDVNVTVEQSAPASSVVTLTVDENGAPVIPEGAKGVRYENNTLTIDEHTTAQFAQGSTVKCDIVNNGTLDGGLFTGTVTGSGSIARGLFLHDPKAASNTMMLSVPENASLNGITKPDATGLTTLYAINTLSGENNKLLFIGDYIGTDPHTFYGWDLVYSLGDEENSGVDYIGHTHFEQPMGGPIPDGMNGVKCTFLPVLEMDASDLTITADKTESKIDGAVIKSVQYVDESDPNAAPSTVYPTKPGSYKAIVTLTCPDDSTYSKARVARIGNLCYHVPETLEVPFTVDSEPVPVVPPTDSTGTVVIPDNTTEVKGDGWTAKKDEDNKTIVEITGDKDFKDTTLNCDKITIGSEGTNTTVSNLTTNAEVTVASGSAIEGGTFSGNVSGTGTIEGGTFSGNVGSEVKINGGVFAGEIPATVESTKVTATGGASINNIQKNEGTNQETAVRVVGEQQLSLAYTPDTGRTFYGWKETAGGDPTLNTDSSTITINQNDATERTFTPVVVMNEKDLTAAGESKITGVTVTSLLYYPVNDAGEITGEGSAERPTEDGSYILVAMLELSSQEPSENGIALFAAENTDLSRVVEQDGIGYYVPESLTVERITNGEDVPSDTGSGDSGAGGAAVAVIGGAAIGGAAYLIGTQVYLTSVLPEGASIPTNRQQLADLLWTAAGKPQPASTALFTDISAEATDSQKAARWCVEQGLLKDTGSTFKPDKHTFRPQVIKAWNDLQAKLNPQK